MKVVQAFGANIGAVCHSCKKPHDQVQLELAIETQKILYCECEGLVKPDVRFEGEPMTPRFYWAMDKIKNHNFSKDGGCDLMVIIGANLALEEFGDVIE